MNALGDHKRFDERANVLGLPNYHEIQSRVPKGSLELRSVEHSVQNPNDLVHFFFINKNNLQGCSHVRVIIGNHEMAAILDCESQTSFITEGLYNKLISNKLRVSKCQYGMLFVSAFGNRTRRIKNQAMLEVKIQDYVFDRLFVSSAAIVAPLIFGIDYLVPGNVVMN